jgi:hypothetical protein
MKYGGTEVGRSVKSFAVAAGASADMADALAQSASMEASFARREQESVPLGRTSSIATSSANNDGGAFELNFRDERYLPFAGAGAISRWTLELPKAFRAFDYGSITDVIVHLSYTAKNSDTLCDLIEDNNQAWRTSSSR